jgi:hypothetical protein
MGLQRTDPAGPEPVFRPLRWPTATALSLLEERRELWDLADRFRRQPAAREAVVSIDEVTLDRALKLAERREDERAPVACRHVPEVLAVVAIITANLELVTTVGALDGRAAPADERVVELVFSTAPLALDVHREELGESKCLEGIRDCHGITGTSRAES